MPSPTTKPTALRLTDTDTIRRLAALEPGERAEVRMVMKEQPDPHLPYHSLYENWHDGKRGVAFRDTETLGAGSKVQILVHSFGAPGTRLRIIAPSTMPLGIAEMQALKDFTTIDCRWEQLQKVSWDEMVSFIESKGWDVANESETDEEDWKAYWDHNNEREPIFDSSCACAEEVFGAHWDAAHPDPEHQWAANPWVWVATLERAES